MEDFLRPEEPEENSGFWQLANASVLPSVRPSVNYPPELVPDFTGMPLRLALREAAARGLCVRVKGRGVVREQSLPPGSRVDGSDLVLACWPPFLDE